MPHRIYVYNFLGKFKIFFSLKVRIDPNLMVVNSNLTQRREFMFLYRVDIRLAYSCLRRINGKKLIFVLIESKCSDSQWSLQT